MFLGALLLTAGVATTMGPSASGALPTAASDEAGEHAHTHGPDGLDLDPRGRQGTAADFAVDTALKAATWSASDHDAYVHPASAPDYPDVAELVGKPQLHAVYVLPADTRQSRFAQFAGMFQADAFQASAFLSAQRNRSLRWDLADRNGKRYLDITFVRSAYKAKQLATSNQFSLVSQDLSRVFPSSTKKFVVWLDATSKYCGQGSLYQDTRRQPGNDNEGRTTGIVYRPYNASDASSGGWCRGRTLLHEIGHNLGALQSVAPHAFDGAHCDDDDNDVMCYTSAATFDSGHPQFDYQSDDYWDPAGGKLAWWTVNLNKFLCPASGCTDANPASSSEY